MKESGPRLGGGAFPAQGAQLLAEKDGCAVWQFQNESGEGTMTVYDVFPGVMLSFNDFHMARYESAYVAGRPLFAIDHCREGRMEYAAGENAVAYTGAGDMKLDLRRQHTGVFRFPSSLDPSEKSVIRMGKSGRNQHAVVLQHPVNFGESLLRLRHDVQGVGHDDHVKAAVGIGQVKHVLHGEMQLGGSVVPFRIRDHLRRCVRGLDMGGAVYDVLGDQSRAGGQLQHGSVPHHRPQQLI